MRILYFTRDYTPHDFRFLTSLAQTENQVFALRLQRRRFQVEERVLPPEVTQISWKGGRRAARLVDFPGYLGSLKQVIDQVKPDLIHAGPIQSSALLAAFSGFHPLVSMSWGSDLLKDAGRNLWMRWATRFTLAHSDVLIGDCQAVQEKAIQFGFPQKKIVLFPWGVDLSHFSPGSGGDLRKRLGWEEKFVLLSLRSWEPVYGVDVVARAFVEAAKKHPQLRLLLLGNGSQASLIHSILEQGQVMDRVHFEFPVSQKDLPDYYRAADLYLSASHSDGSSVSLMEALACGRPVLVSDIPGNLEWITQDQEGWLFPDGEVSALAEKIDRAVTHREDLMEMAVAARVRAEKRANWSVNFQELLKAYEMALAN
jgi:L-malate glycosyltransferase